MGPAKPALVGRPQVPVGIHDLLEQSINRSRHYSGSNHGSPASPSQNSKVSRQGHPNKAEQAPQGKDSRGVMHTTLQATLPEAAFPEVSVSALKGSRGLDDTERTAVPERRKLDYSTDRKADKATGGQSQSCAPAKVASSCKLSLLVKPVPLKSINDMALGHDKEEGHEEPSCSFSSEQVAQHSSCSFASWQ